MKHDIDSFSGRSSAARTVLFLLLTAFSSLAWAGRYVATFGSGGYTYNYGYGYDYGGTAGSGEWGTVYGSYGSDESSGEFEVTLTWSKNDPNDANEVLPPAPKTVVVKETCVAEAGVIGPGTADCDNDLGDPSVPQGSGARSGADANGDPIPHYWSTSDPNGLSSITFTVSPYADAYPGGWGTTITSVHYTVKAEPARIALSGVIDEFKDRTLMIGAKLVATLDIGSFGASGPNNTFAWSVSGGKPFADYDPTKATLQYTGWTSPNAVSTTVYYAKPDDKSTLTCTAALKHLSPTLSVTVSTDVTAQKPAWSATPGAFSSWHLFQPYSTVYDINDSTNPDAFAFYTIGNGSGCIINGDAYTPLAYRGGTSPNYDWGTEAWAQKITANNVTVTASPPVSVNGGTTVGLDGSFPYPTMSHPADSSTLVFRDTPRIENIASTWTALNYTVTFDTYFYYKPPGADSKYVPLRKYTWSIDGGAGRTGTTTWSITKNANSAPGSPEDYPDHMTWSAVKA